MDIEIKQISICFAKNENSRIYGLRFIGDDYKVVKDVIDKKANSERIKGDFGD